MKDIINKGQIISIFTYLLYGIAIIIGLSIRARSFDYYALATVIYWSVTLVILLFLRLSDLRHSRVCYFVYIVFVCVFGFLLQICFKSIFIIFIVYAILWLTIITYLDKSCFHFTVILQFICMAVLKSIPQELSGFMDYDMRAFIFSGVGFIVADWVSINIINILLQLDEETQEHNRSLDDLLEVVEVKHREATQATMAKSNFLSNMSHELRTPLNAIIGLNEMVLRESDDPNVLDYSNDIKTSGTMMLSLVNDILDLSKIESNKMNIVAVDFDMRNVIKDVVKMIGPKMKDKGLDFIMDIDQALIGCYHGDDVRIKQILVNILNNAAKYTKEGSVTLSIKGNRNDKEAYLSFSIKDTGMGIKEEDLQKLNKKFVRIDEEKNRYTEGTGLGISIVNGFLKLMNSELKVSSVYGEGSDFYFDIVLPCVDSIASTKSKVSSDEYFVDENMKILVTDDTELNLKVFVSLLKRNKIQVDTATSGFIAIEKSMQKKYDIIFLDRMMPEMDGIETLKKMKEIEGFINENTPIIALTADAVSGARKTYMDMGFDDYIAKPIVPLQLEELVKKYSLKNKG